MYTCNNNCKITLIVVLSIGLIPFIFHMYIYACCIYHLVNPNTDTDTIQSNDSEPLPKYETRIELPEYTEERVLPKTISI